MRKLFFLNLLVVVLMACGQQDKDWSDLMETGVSRELALFRKEHFKDVRYDLFFNIPESRDEMVSGTVQLSLCVEKRLPLIIDFLGEANQVSSVRLNGEVVPYEMSNEHLFIQPNRVAVGENKLEIAFTAADQSLNRRDEFLYTLLVPDRARTVFPCIDQPDMKALFTLTLNVPSTWQAVANGPVLNTDSTSVAGRNRISFSPTEPLSTYLFSFVAGRLTREEYTRDSRKIAIYHRETDPEKVAQCPAIAGEVFDALRWLEDYTGIPYPFAKYDLIILPGFQYGGMEHTGATLYTDRRMFLDKHPTLDDKLSRSALIAHETAHMWFGDYVTMEWFDDVWTKEVFANYFASRIVEPLYPAVNHRLNFVRDYLPSAYLEDRTAGANPIKQDLANLRDAGLVYGNTIYTKSPVVMEMLTRILGEEAFRRGIQEYLTTFAYGNATWDGLIQILDKHTDFDLFAWSEAWVNEKGMPEITASVEDGALVVRQNDPLGRGIYWPQELTYLVVSGSDSKRVNVSLGNDGEPSRTELGFRPTGSCTIIPNIDGRGYGFFRITEEETKGLWAVLDTSKEEVLRGSTLITIYENLRRNTISPEAYSAAMQAYLPKERNSLLFSLALGYLGDCQRIYPSDTRPLEEMLQAIVNSDPLPQHRLQAFRLYRSVADSEKAINHLYQLWETQVAPKDCSLGENDYIALAYTLAIHMPEKADQIVATQQSRITNPDRKKEFSFISPSVSPRKAERDSVFASLLVAANRRVEPWASAALSNLNHRLRQQESVSYIRPALEAMTEIQRTGDIFFPTAWVRALLSAHTSHEARAEVEAFFSAHPDFHPMLSNKIRQQADHLFK